ncbi:MAG TPA: peptidylprolyl isomerase [Nocardioides sp.]
MLKRTLAVLATVTLFSLAACGGDDTGDSGDPKNSDNESKGTCTYTPEGQSAKDGIKAPPSEPSRTGQVSVTIKSTVGDIPLTLDADKAPCTVNSFISLAEQDFYDDTACPRLGYAPGFAILQCGDPTGTTAGGPGYRFDDELSGNETYPKGTIAMANSGEDTNGSQFFLVFDDSGFQPDYTVFGTIDEAGVERLLEVGKAGDDGSNPAGGGAPNTPVTLTNVVVSD